MKFPWYIWIPRSLLILLAVAMMIITLDSFEGMSSFVHQALSYLMNNLLTVFILLVLWISWKRPFWGGFILMALFLMVAAFFNVHILDKIWFFLMLGVPLLIVSFLFFLAHFKGSKHRKLSPTEEDTGQPTT